MEPAEEMRIFSEEMELQHSQIHNNMSSARGLQSQSVIIPVDMAESEHLDRDMAEKHGWTPLIMASKGGFFDVVNLLLAENPNVNALDQDGRSALAWASKEGHNDIVVRLLQKGAFLNLPDRHGDSPLILASREGHTTVVHTLIASYADAEMVDAEGKTSLYIAVEKGHAGVVNELLLANAITETINKDGETPIFRGIKKKHTQCVKLLLEKGVNININDKNGDNILHVIVRNRCVRMCELLLNDPKHYKLLHQQNKLGETPYSIDKKNKHEMLSQSGNDAPINHYEYERMDLATQQDILLSTLSKFLVEPSLSTPMTIGLYSRWGSGKSAYLQRLAELLQDYRNQLMTRPFTITMLLILGCITCGINFGVVVWAVATEKAGIICGISVTVFLLGIFIFARVTLTSANNKLRFFGSALTIFFHRFMILLKLIYCVPPAIEEFRPILPVHLVMVDLSQSAVVADSPMASLVSFTHELNDAIERDLGIFIPRLYRIFKGTPYRNRPGTDLNFHPHWKVSCCCVPSFIITVFIFTCLWVGLILYNIYGIPGPNTVIAIEIACCCVFGGGLISYILRSFVMIYCMCLPMKKRVKIVSNQAGMQEETFLSVLRQELDIYVDMLECLDGFNHRQTRIVIHIDLVDSLEQQKVLSLINTINLLVTEPGHPFILVLSVDPRLLIKAVDQTLSNIQGPVISPCEYLKNMVDLPFYINEYPKLHADKLIPADLCRQLENKLELSEDEQDDFEWLDGDDLMTAPSQHENENGHVPMGNGIPTKGISDRSVKFPSDQSLVSTEQNTADLHEENISEDISHLLRNNENNTLNDVKRIMNIVSLTGRLLRYHDVPFQWTRLAIWISFCDGWPYKASWITLLSLDSVLDLPGNMSIRRLHSLFGFLMPIIGDRNLGIENSNSYFDTFIASHRPMINVNDARSFAAFMFYIDPTIRKIMIDYLLAMRSSKRNSAKQQVSIVPTMASANSHDPYLWRTNVTPEVLVRMTVDDVASQLLEIEGMNEALLQEYKNRLIDNNVHGRVLMACDLNELREAMQMKFGDWQLFKAWILASRNKDQTNVKINRCEEKISTDLSISCHNSCLDVSQSESSPGTPKPACVQNSYRLPSAEHTDVVNVPYSSHSPRTSPQSTRKFYKHTKATMSVSHESDNGSPNHPNDQVLHHSADSGFASTEVDQNHRLMLTLQRQMCVTDFDKSIENNEITLFASIKSNVIAEHVDEGSSLNRELSAGSSSDSENRCNITLLPLNTQETISNRIENIDTVDITTNETDEYGNMNGSIIDLPLSSRRNRPPSLSEVPLPPVSMLNELVLWPVIPPAEFDDNPNDNHLLPSPPNEFEQVNTKVNIKKSVNHCNSSVSLENENENLLSIENESRSEPYEVEFSTGTNSSLRNASSAEYRWQDI